MAIYTTIQPVEERRSGLFFEDSAIVLREEQEEAIDKAFKYFKKKSNNKYLWNAKMRFGKTLCALELSKRMGELEGDSQVKRTLIVTHRPVVNQSWAEDFDKIFGSDSLVYKYGTKFDDDGYGDFYELEDQVKNEGKRYIFFASMQYLRRSSLVGGDNDEQLKKDLLENQWDLVVIDEAHEGTRTRLGQSVIDQLTKNKETKVLHLSGTPFNLYEDFSDDQIYTWDYIKEQVAKREWPKNHPDEPVENNPYRELPEMEIRTYDLGRLVKSELGQGATFQFKEFFRTHQGQNVPAEKKGKFVHEDEVKQFLDLMCTDDEHSHYPFSTEEYRTFFNHTLWVVPGVKEAKALESLLREHEIFGSFDAIINVAGNNEDDETRQDALDKVKKHIGLYPDQTYTITISCGRLTTGVTVRPWTAVFYLKGSENTSAATYMQTIFRVQSPYTFRDADHQLQMKTKCYVFDFAPDRSLKMVAETAKFATLTQKLKGYARAATTRQKDIENMEEFLSFCPVIAMDGGQMVKFEAEKLFEQLESVYIDRIVRNGFNDNSLYDIKELMELAPEEVKELDDLAIELGKTTNMEKPKRVRNINVAGAGLTKKQKDTAARAKQKQKEGKELTPEEIAALEAERRRKEEERKERDNRITVLRAISLRIPLMMYGADVEDEEEGITLQNFTRLIDDASWSEFMPKGVSKATFNKFKKCYNSTAFVAAGKRYRQLAREADSMHVEERMQRISEIFSYFHNPDKETVLTPWRVVNMHLSETLGGYTFFNEQFSGPNEKIIINTDTSLFEFIPTNEPRFVKRGEVTSDIFSNSDAKILEINSKTGLYPLYMAYSLYRNRKHDFEAVDGLIEDIDNYSIEEEQVIWDDILTNNIYVICNTPMARRITLRTLLGFRELYKKTGYEEMNIKSEKLIDRAISDRDSLVKDLQSIGYWRNNKKIKGTMKFNAVVGNPPYQDSSINNHSASIYHTFIDIAYNISDIATLITPGRFLFGAGDTPTEWNKKIIADKRVCVVKYTSNSQEIFSNVDIKGGIAITMCDAIRRPGPIGTFTSYYELKSILAKVTANDFSPLSDIVYTPATYKLTNEAFTENSFLGEAVGREKRFRTNIFEKVPQLFVEEQPAEDGYIGFWGLLSGNKRTLRWIKSAYVAPNINKDCYKVLVPEANGSGAIGEVLSTPIIGTPIIGHTESFVSIGAFETEIEATNCFNYIKTKFARTLLGTLKVTQHNLSDTWANVPMQDFSASSDIDWTLSIPEIDKLLYQKYNLNDEEIAFIEKMIKPME